MILASNVEFSGAVFRVRWNLVLGVLSFQVFPALQGEDLVAVSGISNLATLERDVLNRSGQFDPLTGFSRDLHSNWVYDDDLPLFPGAILQIKIELVLFILKIPGNDGVLHDLFGQESDTDDRIRWHR